MYSINPVLLQRAVNVCVVGAGGTGSQILTGLAQLHTAMLALGHPGGLSVHVIDDDEVSEANVGRQMFYPCDVGMPKSVVLVNRINLTMGTDWKAEIGRVCENTRFNQTDLVIGCVDNRKARKSILTACQNERKWNGATLWLDIGNRLSDGQCILGEIGVRSKNAVRLPHAADFFPEIADDSIPEDDTPSCSLAAALEKQSLFINRGVSLYALNLLWELFRFGQLNYHGNFVNLKTGSARPLLVDPEAWKRRGFQLH